MCSDFTALGNNVTIPDKLHVSVAIYGVVVMASNQIFLAFQVFNYYFLLSERDLDLCQEAELPVVIRKQKCV